MVNGGSGRLMRWVGGLSVALILLMGLSQTTQAVPNGGYAHPEVLIQPEELKNLLEKNDPGIRIIDVREKIPYLSGHIPRAVQVWRPDIEDKNHPIPGMMAPQAQIEDLMGRLGISHKSTIIIYSDLYDHARLWWVLAYYSFPLKQMKLLDGGIDAWKAKGYPVETEFPRLEKVGFSFTKNPKKVDSLLCSLPEVKEALKDLKKIVLDVRTKKEYVGEEIKKGATRGGRIPGVTWIEWKETIVEGGLYKGYWKPAEEVRKIFSAKGFTPEKDIYLY
jgi:thiosulfate/3-mercaptopyruvate sulfurtransferase